MGLLDFLHITNTQSQKNQNQNRQFDRTGTINIDRKGGIATEAFRIEVVGRVRHSDGSETDLVRARIIDFKNGDTIYFDNANPVCFEVPEGRTDLIREIIEKSYGLKLSHDNYTYIGRIYEAGDYRIQTPSAAINNKIAQMDRELLEEKQLKALQARMAREEQQNAQEKSEEKFKAQYAVREQQENQERLNRLQNPTLKGGINTQIDETYDGINLNNGEILRIRNVKKQAKDLSGTYVYTASISSTPNKYDVELLENDASVPVVFTLPFRLNDIVNSDYDEKYKQQLITQILGLLSKAYQNNLEQGQYPDAKQLHDVGGITKNGQMVPNTEQNVSRPIISKIRELQNNYAIQMQNSQHSSRKTTDDYGDR